MVIRELAAAVLLGACAVVPILLWRARFGHWRITRAVDLVDGARVKIGGTVEALGPLVHAPDSELGCVARAV